MKKRGQVTTFVILGLLVLTVVIVLVYLLSTQNRERISGITASQSDTDSTRREAESLIQLCLEDSVNTGVLNAAEHGGYAAIENLNYEGLPEDENGEHSNVEITPLREIVTYIYPCSYGDIYQSGTINGIPYCTRFPDNDPKGGGFLTITLSFNKFIEEAFKKCVNDFQDFTDKGWQVSSNDINAETSFDKNGVIVTLNVKKTFEKNGNSFSVDSFNFKSDADFIELITYSNDVARLLELNNGRVLARNERNLKYENYKDTFDGKDKYDFIHSNSWSGNDFFAFKSKKNPELIFIFGIYSGDITSLCLLDNTYVKNILKGLNNNDITDEMIENFKKANGC